VVLPSSNDWLKVRLQFMRKLDDVHIIRNDRICLMLVAVKKDLFDFLFA
jgi:hypothetical protein